MQFAERRDYVINCNWKVYVDNYLEGYHIPIAHPGLMREIDYAQYRTETFRYYSQQFAPIRAMKPDDTGERFYAPGSGLAGGALLLDFSQPDAQHLSRQYFHQPDRAAVARQNADHFRVVFSRCSDQPKCRNVSQSAIAFSDEVQQEDIGLCENVQRGLRSSTYDRGRYSVKRENGVHHFHMLLGEFLGRT